ncbi:MAG TPA: tRNA (adenosine(37)-N6)-threonylcarbamoyltransferase complex ATPase subunit type 1 TsaE [Cytophagaceae bacterium]
METSTIVKDINDIELAALPEVAKEIIASAESEKVWIFEGEMGAGKTTLIKELCRQMGVTENTSSPTFSIVNEYLSGKGESIYHFDFYRLKDETEALDIGVEEYLYSGSYCFIEWPSKISSILPSSMLKISINIVAENKRRIQVFRYDR